MVRPPKLSQFDEDGKVGTQINGTLAASFNASNVDSYFGDARRAAWWIEDKNLGRLTVGRYESAGAITTIDLAGISAGASASMILVNGSFLIRDTDWQLYWLSVGAPSAIRLPTRAAPNCCAMTARPSAALWRRRRSAKLATTGA